MNENGYSYSLVDSNGQELKKTYKYYQLKNIEASDAYTNEQVERERAITWVTLNNYWGWAPMTARTITHAYPPTPWFGFIETIFRPNHPRVPIFTYRFPTKDVFSSSSRWWGTKWSFWGIQKYLFPSLWEDKEDCTGWKHKGKSLIHFKGNYCTKMF